MTLHNTITLNFRISLQQKVVGIFFILLLFSFVTQATPANQTLEKYDGKQLPDSSAQTPKELEGVGIDQKLGTQLALSDIYLNNEKGEKVSLGSFYDGKHPVIISLVYFSCPGLCNFHLNGLTDGLKGVNWNPGEKFQIIAVSFDANETPNMAAGKKVNYLKSYGRPETANGWHFLTADQENINKLTQSVGFKYKWNDKEKEWSHASAAIVTTPGGVISRYLGGIMFDAKDIKLALNEATNGQIGTFVDKVLLFCFHYDPKANTYALYAFNLVRMGGVLIILILLIWLIPFWFRNKKEDGTVRS